MKTRVGGDAENLRSWFGNYQSTLYFEFTRGFRTRERSDPSRQMGRLIIKIVQFIVFSLCVCVEYLFVIFRFFTHILDRYFLLSPFLFFLPSRRIRAIQFR